MIKWSEWPLAGTGEVWCTMRVILKQKRERESILETQRRSDELCLLESGKGFHKSWYLSKHWRRGQRKERIVVTFLHACMLSCFSHDQFFATLWTVAYSLLCPCAFSGKNTGIGCHFLLQGIFPTQESNLCLLCFLHWQADSLPLSHWGSPMYTLSSIK